MALRDQPYLPLYIQDFLTDEKLIECSALATGVYVRLMCIMHKSEEYGKILLKQKDKQTTNQIKNFASKLAKQMPYDYETVASAIEELLQENVIHLEGDFLCQKRMVKDNALSLLRAKAGKKGGQFAQAKTKANGEANTENVNENVNENGDCTEDNKKESDFEFEFKTAFDEGTMEGYERNYKHKGIDVAEQLKSFRLKCDNDRGSYYTRSSSTLRTNFQYQLDHARNGAKSELSLGDRKALERKAKGL